MAGPEVPFPLSLNAEERALYEKELTTFGSFKCVLCAADPSFHVLVAALKEAKKKGALKSRKDLDDAFSSAQKLSGLIAPFLPGFGPAIAALVSFGIGQCKSCVEDKVF